MKKALLIVMTAMILLPVFSVSVLSISEPPMIEWEKTYGGSGHDVADEVVQTSDGGYALAGYTSFGAGYFDFWLVKTDEFGNMLWNKTYGGSRADVCYTVIERGEEYILAGFTESFGAGGKDCWLLMTDSIGNLEWNKTYGGVNEDKAHFGVQTSDGGYVLAGYTTFSGAEGRDFWLVKTDTSGNMEWNKTYGGVGHDDAWSVKQTSDGGFIVAGITGEIIGGPGDVGESLVIKTDSAGNVQWQWQTYAGTHFPLSVIQTGDGGYCVAGQFGPWPQGDLWLIKIAPEEISATIDIVPDALNLRSKGKWITCYIELPEGYDVGDIDVSSILLNGTIPVDPEAPTQIGDYDSDGIPDLMIKFSRAEVIALILSHIDPEEKFGKATLTITGTVAGIQFEGSDTIETVLTKRSFLESLEY